MIHHDEDGEDLSHVFEQRRRHRYHQLPRIDALAQDEMMRKIEGNDPTLTKLEVGLTDEGYHLPNDWEGFGNAIGTNTHLEEVSLHDAYGAIPIEFLMMFFLGLVSNQSIRKLSFAGWDLYNEAILSILIPFFHADQTFDCLEVDDNCENTHGSLASTLRRFDSLKEFHLTNDHGRCASADDAISALTCHVRLKKLTLAGAEIRCTGGAALAALLRHPRSNLTALHLDSASIDDQTAGVIAIGLYGNTTLKVLEISQIQEITGYGWKYFFDAFPRCSVETLDLHSNYLTDATVQVLSNVLCHNCTIKTLELSNNEYVTIAGWNFVFQLLQDSYSVLEELNLNDNSITDQGLAALTNVLATNTRLKKLNLQSIHSVTVTGWQNFSIVLRFANSALETLNLSRNPINDQTANLFADTLRDNRRLRELDLDLANSSNSAAIHAIFTTILSNNSSIVSTFNSNHTLEKLCSESDLSSLSNDLLFQLRLNRENNLSQAARIKIITAHFSGHEINMQPFMDMDLSVRPHALAWMARDDSKSYQFLRTMPSLLEKVEE